MKLIYSQTSINKIWGANPLFYVMFSNFFILSVTVNGQSLIGCEASSCSADTKDLKKYNDNNEDWTFSSILSKLF